MGIVVSICSAGNDSVLCQILRKLGIPDFGRSRPKRILPVSRLQPGLDKALQNHALQLKFGRWAAGCSLVHAAAPRVTLLSIPAFGGCYTRPRSQREPKWHPAPQSARMQRPLGQEGSELQPAEGWRGRNWGPLLAHPIATVLLCTQGGAQPAWAPTCTTHCSHQLHPLRSEKPRKGQAKAN